MVDEQTLRDLLNRAEQGDQQACTDLVHQFELQIRRAVRVHLPSDDPLRRLFNSMDISQSVFIQFFKKARLGAIQFQSPKMLRKLLRRMAVQKFIDKKREAEAQRRDHRSTRTGETVDLAVDPDGASPDEIVATRELYQEICRRFTQRELQIAELWVAGHSFPEIGERVRGTDGESLQPDAVRMILRRAFVRVARQLPQGE
jgi:DNA-directed RNA polymerase specialized sigma24 family protein